MLIFNTNQLNSLQEIFVTVLILHPTLIFLAFRAYLLEPPPQDYITKGKTMKKYQNSNEVKNGCTHSRIRIGSAGCEMSTIIEIKTSATHQTAILLP